MNPYQEFIAKSRYSRYLPEEQRRENWAETTERWISFFQERFKNRPIPEATWAELRDSILNLKALPSMRTVMTAGPALARTEVAAYNCSYLPVDHPRSFDEAMYILLCGTGVGFSVEDRYVSQLPTLPPELREVDETITVEDSKEGWCYAFQHLLDYLWSGLIPKWDISGVRPEGAPLKTFGGRASGPGPLVDLFEYTIARFRARLADGSDGPKRLTTLDCHDIMCKIGEIVVVGGVRRSAMISLGDLNDQQHATAKSGKWWEVAPERALSNNSAIYTAKPALGDFLREWATIYESNSGERGIINRAALQKQASRFGRRPADVDYGTNPCAEIILKPYQFCNLSTAVIRHDDSRLAILEKIRLATIFGTMQSTLTNFDYLRPVWRENTEEERLLGVSMTGPLDNKLFTEKSANADGFKHELRMYARMVNEEWAAILGVAPSKAITCIKPEGTVSQLTLTASGLHTSHAPFFIRRVRQDWKDPLTQFMIAQGVPYEQDIMNPAAVVFSFPMKAEGMVRSDLTATQHLDIWLNFQKHYCEHKPSVTISVKPHEWFEVGKWIYDNFDDCTGVSVLPDDGGSYQQAPYEEITGAQYAMMLSMMPKIDWSLFREVEDNVAGVQMLACTAGGCEVSF